jgi:carbon storage regulator
MLVLTRDLRQTLIIGSEVSIVVLGVNGGQVKLGIEAPRNISVHRQEVFERISKGSATAPLKRDASDTAA